MNAHEQASALNGAQKRAMMAAEEDGHLGKRFIRWWQADGQTLRALSRKGFAFAVWSGVCLTRSGEQVRAILESTNAFPR